jgi:hypothetical protein
MLPDDDYHSITLNATGRDWINKTGTTKFCLRASDDIVSNPPPDFSPYMSYGLAEYYSYEKGSGYRPQLIVTYTTTSPGYSLPEAIDRSNLNIATGGTANWMGQTTTYYYGGDAAQSGGISHDQQTWMQTIINGSGKIKFYWKVSSEQDFDYLNFYIDDNLESSISGAVGWQQETYDITSTGTHILKWQYVKDGSVSSGSDCGWVDKVECKILEILSPSIGHLLKDSHYYFRVYAAQSPSSVLVKYTKIRDGAYDNTEKERTLCTLSREGSSEYYSGTYLVNSRDYPLLENTPPPLFVIEPEIKIVATYSGGDTISVSQTDPLCYNNSSYYEGMDSTFWWNKADNPIVSIFTGNFNPDWCYNCMAYALDLSSAGWLWPWPDNPSDLDLTNTMVYTYGYSTYSQTMLPWTDVIYYTGGHFTRVVAWDGSTGEPLAIASKWGGLEVIFSDNPDPFTGIYGSADYYFIKW